jgi:hypothetical protein
MPKNDKTVPIIAGVAVALLAVGTAVLIIKKDSLKGESK